jgi:hypothetical protein
MVAKLAAAECGINECAGGSNWSGETFRGRLDRMQKRALPWGWLAALALVTIGCRGQTPSAGESPTLTDDTYVSVMVDLLRVGAKPAEAETEEERQVIMDSVRAEVLALHGVTARELIEFADLAGSDPGHMEGMWQRISQALDSTRAADSRHRTEALSEPDGEVGEATHPPADTGGASGRAGAREAASGQAPSRGPQDARARLDSMKRSRTAREGPGPDR